MFDTLEDFLNKQQNNNKNQKFSDSSPTSSVYGRLGYDFTPSDPSILTLSDETIKSLSSMPKLLKDWQAEDLRTGTVGDYYKNPVRDITSTIVAQLTNIESATTYYTAYDPLTRLNYTGFKVPALSEIYYQSTYVVQESENFLAHTDRLSNITLPNENTADLPHYQMVMGVGKSLIYLLYQTDGIQNNSPIIGSFTSILIGEELNQASNTISQYANTISNSIIVTEQTGEFGNVFVYSTSLTTEEIGNIVTDIKSIKTLLEKRRRHDENFWTNSKKISNEYNTLSMLNTPGETQQKLLDGYVGSTKYKESSLINDVPVTPTYNVTVGYDGTMTYESNDPSYNSYSIPSSDVRTEPISGQVDYYTDLPSMGNIVGDEYFIVTTCEVYRWSGSKWIFIAIRLSKSPIINLEEYIQTYNANTLTVNVAGGYQLSVNPGALIFESDNGVWANNRTISITNTGEKDYPYYKTEVTNFLYSEIDYSYNPEDLSTINVGETVLLNVTSRSVTEGDSIDYGIITIYPGIDIQTKVVSTQTQYGILTPNVITQNVGSSTNKLPINVVSGPFKLLSVDSTGLEDWTWKNYSENDVTISSIENISPSGSLELSVTLLNATTPNTIGEYENVLWYANVTPHVVKPNTSIFKVKTTDGQERLMYIGIDEGNVDDSSLYTEVINTSPDIIVTSSPFTIRVYGGKANTYVTYSGPNSSGTKMLSSNGYTSIANNIITSTGSYTWSFNFEGTGHTRTLTKAIYS